MSSRWGSELPTTFLPFVSHLAVHLLSRCKWTSPGFILRFRWNQSLLVWPAPEFRWASTSAQDKQTSEESIWLYGKTWNFRPTEAFHRMTEPEVSCKENGQKRLDVQREKHGKDLQLQLEWTVILQRTDSATEYIIHNTLERFLFEKKLKHFCSALYSFRFLKDRSLPDFQAELRFSSFSVSQNIPVSN